MKILIPCPRNEPPSQALFDSLKEYEVTLCHGSDARWDENRKGERLSRIEMQKVATMFDDQYIVSIEADTPPLIGTWCSDMIAHMDGNPDVGMCSLWFGEGAWKTTRRLDHIEMHVSIWRRELFLLVDWMEETQVGVCVGLQEKY